MLYRYTYVYIYNTRFTTHSLTQSLGFIFITVTGVNLVAKTGPAGSISWFSFFIFISDATTTKSIFSLTALSLSCCYVFVFFSPLLVDHVEHTKKIESETPAAGC